MPNGEGSASTYRGAVSSSIPNFVLTNREGYSTWKFRMRNYLLHEELWDTVVGFAPDDSTPLCVRSKIDQKALSKICLTLDGPPITYVRAAKTAKEAWDSLKSAYEDKSMGRRLSLERKLYRMTLDQFENIESYINGVLSAALDLADIGKVIDDASIAAILLGGLGSRYEPLVMAIENSNANITTEMVKTKLLNEMAKNQNETSTESALGSINRPGKLRKKNKPIVCYDCNTPGHKRPDCPFRKKKPKTKEATALTALAVSEVDKKDVWYIDSGATKHLTFRSEWLSNFKPIDFGKVTVANGDELVCQGIGDVSINTEGSINSICDVMLVPNLNTNLLSVKRVVDKGFSVLFDKSGCNFFETKNFSYSGNSILHGSPYGGLYALDCTINNHQVNAYDVHSDSCSRYLLWHKRLGHLCRIGMDQLKNRNVGVDYTVVDKGSCIACVEGKQARKPFKKVKYEKATKMLELVHSDLCGPMSISSFQGNKYVLLFIDDFSRFVFPYFLSSKTEILEKFCSFQSLVEKQTGAQIKKLRTDNGTEYVNKRFTDYLTAQGIIHQTTVPYSPQQNGVAERTNRSIVEKARSMLAESSLAKAYWEDAFSVAVYLKNRCPHRALSCGTPFEKWFGDKPDLSSLKVFGCRALVNIPSCHRSKLDSKANEHIFVGYSDDPNAYYLRNASNPRKMIKSRDIVFYEDCFTELKINKSSSHGCQTAPILENSRPIDLDFNPIEFSSEAIQRERQGIVETGFGNNDCESGDVQTETIEHDPVDNTVYDSPNDLSDDPVDNDHHHCTINNVNDERRYPLRNRRPPDFLTYLAEDNLVEPITYSKAVTGPDAEKWRSAMQCEYESLMKLKTWQLVEKPNRKIIPCKWVYKLKTDSLGNVVKYKARLVVKGFNQIAGVDYYETFAPVIRNSSLRTLFALAAENGLMMRHIDVDTAFLNGDLEEEVYMYQPEGFVVKNQEHKVCSLNKSLYGLKQAPRAWNIKLDETLVKIGFHRTPSEPCIYKKLFGSETVLLAIYVDDIIIFYKDVKSFEVVKKDIEKYFSIKDLGLLNFYLGLNISQKDGKIVLNQITYINKVLKQFNMENCKGVKSPLQKLKLDKGSENVDKNIPYQQLVGCLMFLAVNTRPDIAYTVSFLSQFLTCYDKRHWNAAKRVLNYLKGTVDYSITYNKTGRYLECFADADFANSFDRRSYTGFCVKLGDGPISWESKKQHTVALSSTEAEYLSLAAAAKDVIFLRRLICELTGKCQTVVIYTDSQSARQLALNPVHHNRTKHIDVRFHFIREKINNKVINLKYMPSEELPADALTKPLGPVKFKTCIVNMGIS